jgi:hypothetical protein
MIPPPPGTRITAVVNKRPERGFVVTHDAEAFAVYLDDQYARGDFKTKYIFQLKDEGVTWARGWGQSTDVLMAAYTLAGSDW